MNSITNIQKLLVAFVFLTMVFFAFSTLNNDAFAWDADFGGGCCGGESGGDPGTSYGGDSPLDPQPQPVVCNYLKSDKTTLPAGGGNITLSWSTSNATGVTLWGSGDSVNSGTTPNIGLSGSIPNVPLDRTKTFWLDVWNSKGETAKCSVTITVEQPVHVPAPSCDYLNASTTKVPAGGGNVTLSWGTTNGTGVTLWGSGDSVNSGTTPNIGLDGSKTVFVDRSKTFTLQVWNSKSEKDECSVTVTVDNKPADKPAKCDFLSASPTRLPAGGGNVTLNWGTTDATNVSISGIGSVAADGSRTVNVTASKTFTLTAQGAGGNDSCTASIVVDDKPEEKVAKCDFLTASPNHLPHGGGNVTLNWGTTDATNVSISGIGSVSVDGSKSVFVSSNTTFTLTAQGTNNNDTCTASVTIGDKPEDKIAKCDFFTANPTKLDDDGNVTLSWGTTNATSVYINQGIGAVSDDGSRTVHVNDDTTFVLTAGGTNNSDSCSVSVRIEEEDDDEPTPRCELDISKSRVNRGERVTLSWETKHTDDIRIRDDHGNTIFDTDDYRSSERKRYLDGEVDIIINQATEFTMTARGDGGSRTCRVDIDVDDLAVYEKRDQGMVIALTQVPYTGFEAGPFLTFLFYAVLTLWALFVAYILVVKKGSILGFSLYGNTATVSETDLDNRKKVDALVAKYADKNWN